MGVEKGVGGNLELVAVGGLGGHDELVPVLFARHALRQRHAIAQDGIAWRGQEDGVVRKMCERWRRCEK